MRRRLTIAAIALGVLLGDCVCSSALNPSLEISEFARTSWTTRDGFFLRNIYATTPTPDECLWRASQFGSFRLDGVRGLLWQRPAGESSAWALSPLATPYGTLWIGTYKHGKNTF